MFIFIMLLSIGVGIITGGSLELMWSLANTLQVMFFFGMLSLYYSSELKATFSYMKYSNFDNPAFEFIRSKVVIAFTFVKATLPSGFSEFGYSSVSIVINFFDKLIMIALFIIFVVIIYIMSVWLKNKSGKIANFIKRKDIDIRYEGLSRFFMEFLLNLSIVNFINLIYGDFNGAFDAISYLISIFFTIVTFFMIGYCFAYPAFYYSQIWTHPDFHERHCFLFLEFNKEKSKNLFFYAYFALHRYFFALLVIWMYNFPHWQWVLISFLNFLFLIYTFKMYTSWLQNFLHTFNWVIQLLFSTWLFLFLSSSNPKKLMIWGYVRYIDLIGELALWTVV